MAVVLRFGGCCELGSEPKLSPHSPLHSVGTDLPDLLAVLFLISRFRLNSGSHVNFTLLTT